MIRGWIFIFLGLVFDGTGDCNSGRFVDDWVRFQSKIFGNRILSWWRHDFLLSQNVIQKMPSLHLFVNAINNRLLDVMIPQFQFVTWNTLLITPLIAHLCDFFNRKFVLSSLLYSFRRSWHLFQELPVRAWCTPLPSL